MLIIGSPELHESRRLIAEGRALGFRVEAAPIQRLSFVLRPPKRTARLDDRDVFRAFDTLYFRHFYPYISEALHLAEWADHHGLRVIDRVLVRKNFIQSKMYDYWKLGSAGIPVPSGFQVMSLDAAKRHLGRSRWPLVAKGVHGSRGRYVFKLASPRSARRSLTEDLIGLFTFQDYLEIDAEYRVLTVGFKAIGAMRKIRPPNDFRHNIAVGAVGAAASLSREIAGLCERASRALGREFAGVDLAVCRGRPYVLEVNRMPGFEGFEQATGINAAAAFLNYAARKK